MTVDSANIGAYNREKLIELKGDEGDSRFREGLWKNRLHKAGAGSVVLIEDETRRNPFRISRVEDEEQGKRNKPECVRCFGTVPLTPQRSGEGASPEEVSGRPKITPEPRAERSFASSR